TTIMSSIHTNDENANLVPVPRDGTATNEVLIQQLQASEAGSITDEMRTLLGHQ
ncbi:hypothetical protein BGX28_006806, partial [Mortierella sp. GBA30]